MSHRIPSGPTSPREDVREYARIVTAENQQIGAKRSRRQIFWERLLASTVLLYTVGATFVVWRTLEKYGVNVLLFFIIDGITSWTYGIATARLIVSAIKREWRAVRKWAEASAISFVVPQIYILVSARHAPHDVYLTVIIVISFLSFLAALTLLLQIRRSRRDDVKRRD